jgi:hypothetical protein
MRAAVAVAAVAVAAAAVWLVLGLASDGSTRAGTNGVLLGAYVATVPAGKSACQAGEQVPANAAELEIFAGVFGRPGPPVGVTVGGREAGGRAGGYADGWIRVPLAAPFRGRSSVLSDQRICIVNRGSSRLALGGLPGAAEPAVDVGRSAARGRFSFRWTAARSGSWWSQAATIARRATFGKADLGRERSPSCSGARG